MASPNPLTVFIINFGKIWLEHQRIKQIRFTILLIISQLTIIIFFFTKLPPQIPLFFSRPWGELQLTSPFYLLLLPFFSLIVLLINLLLASLLLEKNEFLANTLISGSPILTLFALIAVIRIIFLAT